MKNEWTHKTRAFRKHGILANLNCRLTMEEFELSLLIMRDQELVVDKVILRTDPDEIAFEQRFKDIEIHEDQLTVTAKRGDPLWHCSLSNPIVWGLSPVSRQPVLIPAKPVGN